MRNVPLSWNACYGNTVVKVNASANGWKHRSDIPMVPNTACHKNADAVVQMRSCENNGQRWSGSGTNSTAAPNGERYRENG